MSRRAHHGSPEARVALATSLLGLAVAAVTQVRTLRAAQAAESTSRSLEDLGETRRRGTTDDARLGLQAAGRTVPRRNVFIAHAHEDKRTIARPLTEQLQARGCSVWFDEYDIVLGDSLRSQIGDGLLNCQVGVVILSHSFFKNQWSRWELDGLIARHIAGEQNVILPVWHGVTLDDVRSYSPPLADLRAAQSSDGTEAIADAVVRVLIRYAGKRS
jgi:hypothetical protein